MGDFISRSVAIEEIWNVFNSYVNDDSRFDEFETEAINRAFKVLQNRIEKQPKAYSVENVVAELEKASVGAFDIQTISFRRAVNIVRKGGIDERT